MLARIIHDFDGSKRQCYTGASGQVGGPDHDRSGGVWCGAATWLAHRVRLPASGRSALATVGLLPVYYVLSGIAGDLVYGAASTLAEPPSFFPCNSVGDLPINLCCWALLGYPLLALHFRWWTRHRGGSRPPGAADGRI